MRVTGSRLVCCSSSSSRTRCVQLSSHNSPADPNRPPSSFSRGLWNARDTALHPLIGLHPPSSAGDAPKRTHAVSRPSRVQHRPATHGPHRAPDPEPEAMCDPMSNATAGSQSAEAILKERLKLSAIIAKGVGERAAEIWAGGQHRRGPDPLRKGVGLRCRPGRRAPAERLRGSGAAEAAAAPHRPAGPAPACPRPRPRPPCAAAVALPRRQNRARRV